MRHCRLGYALISATTLGIFMHHIIICDFVIPAKAGIQIII